MDEKHNRDQNRPKQQNQEREGHQTEQKKRSRVS